MTVLLFPLSARLAVAQEFQGKKLDEGLYQLTGNYLLPGSPVNAGDELPDAAPPYVAENGEVEIYGSAPYFIRYADWKSFLEGGSYKKIPLRFFSNDGQPYIFDYTHPWDVRKYRVILPTGETEEILIGGAMTAGVPGSSPLWPNDNPSRRIFIFRQAPDGTWIRNKQSIYGDPKSGWMGHSYGGNFFQAHSSNPSIIDLKSGAPLYFFFEKVDHSEEDRPTRTQIYAMNVDFQGRESDEFLALSGMPKLILGVTDPATEKPFPSTKRSTGGYLIEGPRPIKAKIQGKDFYFIGFSGGDFCTDGYTTNFAWSHTPLGPYQPLLNKDGTDFLDYGHKLRNRYQLSWVGRPVLYETPEKNYEIMFHAVNKHLVPDNDYTNWPVHQPLNKFYRVLLKANVRLDLHKDGTPRIESSVIYPAQEVIKRKMLKFSDAFKFFL